jgi:hypothetical protein
MLCVMRVLDEFEPKETTKVVVTLALGSQPRQRGYKVADQEEARESRQRSRKGAG